MGALVALGTEGVSVISDLRNGLPRMLHRRARTPASADDLSHLASLADAQHGADGLTCTARLPAVLPERSAGWMGTPGLEDHRGGTASSSLTPTAQPGRIRLSALAADACCRVEPVHLCDSAPHRMAGVPPSWWLDPPSASGHALGAVGLQGAMLHPEHALLLRLVAQGGV